MTTKALHHYHQLGLLEPVFVDPVSGYRYYDVDQVDQAHLVRRLRGARMPLAQVRAAVAARGAAREQHLLAHLYVLRGELLETAAAVTSLSALLGRSEPIVFESFVPEQWCLASSSEVSPAELGAWCSVVYPQLAAAARTMEMHPQGPYGAMYDSSWFSGDGGTITAFLPVDVPPSPSVSRAPALEGIALRELPSGAYLAAVREGPCSELDLTYGYLGRRVLDLGAGGEGAIRENYVVTAADNADPRALRTEVCWPVMAA